MFRTSRSHRVLADVAALTCSTSHLVWLSLTYSLTENKLWIIASVQRVGYRVDPEWCAGQMPFSVGKWVSLKRGRELWIKNYICLCLAGRERDHEWKRLSHSWSISPSYFSLSMYLLSACFSLCYISYSACWSVGQSLKSPQYRSLQDIAIKTVEPRQLTTKNNPILFVQSKGRSRCKHCL